MMLENMSCYHCIGRVDLFAVAVAARNTNTDEESNRSSQKPI